MIRLQFNILWYFDRRRLIFTNRDPGIRDDRFFKQCQFLWCRASDDRVRHRVRFGREDIRTSRITLAVEMRHARRQRKRFRRIQRDTVSIDRGRNWPVKKESRIRSLTANAVDQPTRLVHSKCCARVRIGIDESVSVDIGQEFVVRCPSSWRRQTVARVVTPIDARAARESDHMKQFMPNDCLQIDLTGCVGFSGIKHVSERIRFIKEKDIDTAVRDATVRVALSDDLAGDDSMNKATSRCRGAYSRKRGRDGCALEVLRTDVHLNRRILQDLVSDLRRCGLEGGPKLGSIHRVIEPNRIAAEVVEFK